MPEHRIIFLDSEDLGHEKYIQTTIFNHHWSNDDILQELNQVMQRVQEGPLPWSWDDVKLEIEKSGFVQIPVADAKKSPTLLIGPVWD